MVDEFSKLAFDADLEEALGTPDASRWVIDRVDGQLEMFVTAYPIAHPEEKFQARFFWTTYPGEPPSFKFRDLTTGRLNVLAAWPEISGYRPGNYDACVNWTAEGFVAHPEWKNDANIRWKPDGNVLLKVLRLYQRDLDDKFIRRVTG